ncbi:MAG: hypothetical protein JWO82_3257, partial [Akkermansiaceae bacterium]|nr:hypothetical protein [Akkermansiaceae bacterium]
RRITQTPDLNDLNVLVQAATLELKKETMLLAARQYYERDDASRDNRQATVRGWLTRHDPAGGDALADQVRREVEAGWDRAATEAIEKAEGPSHELGFMVLYSCVFRGPLKERALKIAEGQIKDPDQLRRTKERIEENSKR